MSTAVEANPRRFKVDARALISLGRESIKDHTTALIELVKNAYDADAENVEVEIVSEDNPLSDFVRISDDGLGMASDDIDKKWLRIGFSEKRQNKVSAKGRRETGEKGIGRLSSDRLGAVLQLRSKGAHTPAVGVEVNWDDFDTDEAELGSVPISELAQPNPVLSKRNPESRQHNGTEIIIKSLRQRWIDSDLATLATELSTLVPASSGKNAFQIWLKTRASDQFIKMESVFDGQAELLFTSNFDSKGTLNYQVTAKPEQGSMSRNIVKSGKVPWNQLVPSTLGAKFDLGRTDVRLGFFLRASVSLSGSLTLTKLREYLDAEGGIRIYRDGIRVKPYGDPLHAEGDWLGLANRKASNPAGAGRSDFRISTNQLVGSVLIGRDTNPKLTDSSAREGLIHSDSFSSLKSAVFGCVELLETIYHEQYVKLKNAQAEPPDEKPQLPMVVSEIKSTLSELSKDLATASKAATSDKFTASAVFKNSLERLELVVEKVAKAEKEIEEMASQNTIYRGLATVGISAAVFGHETESSLAQAKLSTTTARRFLSIKNPNLPEAIDELGKAEKAIGKVELWGQFAIVRMKKDKRKRTRVDLSKLLTGIVTEIRPLFAASKIELEVSIDKSVELRAFPMDIESLTLNLLTNAFHAASRSARNRKVVVAMNLVGKGTNQTVRIVVADSGPGITKEHLNRIWEPLFSTKVDDGGRPIGTGLGLTIVRSIAKDMGASAVAIPKGALGGASFEIQIPIKH